MDLQIIENIVIHNAVGIYDRKRVVYESDAIIRAVEERNLKEWFLIENLNSTDNGCLDYLNPLQTYFQDCYDHGCLRGFFISHLSSRVRLRILRLLFKTKLRYEIYPDLESSLGRIEHMRMCRNPFYSNTIFSVH